MINPFKKTYSTQELNIFRFLTKIPLFKELNYSELSMFLPFLYLRQYKQDEALFFRNDPAHALYLIKNGRVTTNVDIKDTFEELKVYKSGEALGHSALIPEVRRTRNAVVSSENAEFYVIPQVNILEVFEESPAIKAKMMTALALRNHRFVINLIRSYQASYGFFNLSQAYQPTPE